MEFLSHGEYSYSDIISVNRCKEKSFDFTPYQQGGNVMLNINTEIKGEYFLELMDLRGRIVLSDVMSLEEGNNNITLSPTISNGLYNIRIFSPDLRDRSSKKLIYSK